MSAPLTLSRDMPVIVQSADLGPCGRWIEAMRRYGTNIAACVSPAAGRDRFDDLPLFRHCAEAQTATRAAACVSVMPPRTAADSVLEAAEAGIGLVVSLSTGIPVHDTMRIRRRVAALDVAWIGGASSGIARPAATVMLGAIPLESLLPGNVALLSTSSGLAAEAGFRMRQEGVGQSLYVDVGSDLVKGTRLDGMIERLKTDDETRAVALLGTTAGTEEEEFARAMQETGLDKPVLAYIAGRTLPDPSAGTAPAVPGGADAARKEAALAAAGARIYNSLGALVAALKAAA
jgi:succinyl-CoA synthetase alpha subunit